MKAFMKINVSLKMKLFLVFCGVLVLVGVFVFQGKRHERLESSTDGLPNQIVSHAPEQPLPSKVPDLVAGKDCTALGKLLKAPATDVTGEIRLPAVIATKLQGCLELRDTLKELTADNDWRIRERAQTALAYFSFLEHNPLFFRLGFKRGFEPIGPTDVSDLLAALTASRDTKTRVLAACLLATPGVVDNALKPDQLYSLHSALVSLLKDMLPSDNLPACIPVAVTILLRGQPTDPTTLNRAEYGQLFLQASSLNRRRTSRWRACYAFLPGGVGVCGDDEFQVRLGELLAKLSDDPNPGLRLAAVTALGAAYPQRLYSELPRLAKDSSSLIRSIALNLVKGPPPGEVTSPTVREAVIDRMADGEPSIRAAAIYTAERLGISEVVKRLLDDQDAAVSQAAQAVAGCDACYYDHSPQQPEGAPLRQVDLDALENLLRDKQDLESLGNVLAKLSFYGCTAEVSKERIASIYRMIIELIQTEEGAALDSFILFQAADRLLKSGDYPQSLRQYIIQEAIPAFSDIALNIERTAMATRIRRSMAFRQDALEALEYLRDHRRDYINQTFYRVAAESPFLAYMIFVITKYDDDLPTQFITLAKSTLASQTAPERSRDEAALFLLRRMPEDPEVSSYILQRAGEGNHWMLRSLSDLKNPADRERSLNMVLGLLATRPPHLAHGRLLEEAYDLAPEDPRVWTAIETRLAVNEADEQAAAEGLVRQALQNNRSNWEIEREWIEDDFTRLPRTVPFRTVEIKWERMVQILFGKYKFEHLLANAVNSVDIDRGWRKEEQRTEHYPFPKKQTISLRDMKGEAYLLSPKHKAVMIFHSRPENSHLLKDFKPSGTSIVQGQVCDSYVRGTATVCIWNGIVLEQQWDIKGPKGTLRFRQKTTEITLNPPLNPDLFQIPAGWSVIDRRQEGYKQRRSAEPEAKEQQQGG